MMKNKKQAYQKKTMVFTILDHCIACTTCSTVCPNIFALHQRRAIVINQPRCKQDETKSMLALKSCPVSAIGIAYASS